MLWVLKSYLTGRYPAADRNSSGIANQRRLAIEHVCDYILSCRCDFRVSVSSLFVMASSTRDRVKHWHAVALFLPLVGIRYFDQPG